MKYLSLGLVTAGLMLSACGGGKLNEKTALKALQEAQEPVRFTRAMLTDYSDGHYQDNKIFYAAYEKAGLIGKPPKSMDRMSNDLNLNEKKVSGKWGEYIERKPAGNGGEIITVYNYMSRPGKVLRINSKPVDRLCDAVAEYTYERYDYAPWGKELEKKQWPQPTVWQACMIKYDKSWGVKNWNKKKTGRR